MRSESGTGDRELTTEAGAAGFGTAALYYLGVQIQFACLRTGTVAGWELVAYPDRDLDFRAGLSRPLEHQFPIIFSRRGR